MKYTKRKVCQLLYLFIERYKNSDLKELSRFANDLEKDIEVVKSSIVSNLSNSFVEGTNSEFYNEGTKLKELPSSERLQKRQEIIKPLVEDFFVWVKQQIAEYVVLPESKTAQGLNYIVNQEVYLKVFLTDGNVPIDNSASERSIRTFCLSKKNWMFHNTGNGATASAMVYSISETAKLNNLRP